MKRRYPAARLHIPNTYNEHNYYILEAVNYKLTETYKTYFSFLAFCIRDPV